MKKIWLIPMGIALVIVLSVGAYFLAKQTSRSIVSPNADSQTVEVTPSVAPVERTTWKDEAGFSFSYPKNLKVNKHEEDNDSYAHVELTDVNHSGSVIVWVKDLPAKVETIDAWAKQKQFIGGSMLDTTLGGEKAKKILLTNSESSIFVGTISDSLLFMVEGVFTDGDFWTPIYVGVVDSFTFVSDEVAPPQTGGATGATYSDDVDEEEMIE